MQPGVLAIAFDFSRRADLTLYPELMDQPCRYEDLRGCLRSIASVNRLTLAYRPTLSWLESLRCANTAKDRPLHIVDVGCGYGDMLRRIHRWAGDRHVPVILTGIDLNPDAVRAAREVTPPEVATFLVGNAYAFDPPGGIDVVISSLLTHHLENAAIVDLLVWMEVTAKRGWFINDLHRQPLPYRAFRVFRGLTTWHPFVKHDGAVSILRSFRRDDWRALLRAAAIPEAAYELLEVKPARLCVGRRR